MVLVIKESPPSPPGQPRTPPAALPPARASPSPGARLGGCRGGGVLPTCEAGAGKLSRWQGFCAGGLAQQLSSAMFFLALINGAVKASDLITAGL